MENHYNRNGLVFWSEEEIGLRERFVGNCVDELKRVLKGMNAGFQFVRVEAPILTPWELINSGYTDDDVFTAGDLALRPETTMGSYEAANSLLSGYGEVRYRTPLVVWQHGKSFRREQDQPTKFMRLKEFHQLEFQVLFALSTANDYYGGVVEGVRRMLSLLVGPCKVEASDRLPSYSLETTDVICEATNMEVCSISRRTDYEGLKNIEVAIGTDRLVYNWKQRELVV